jgi:hypothetical protein
LFRKPSVFGIAAGAAAAENIPSRFNLYQNYPNPFNPATEIRYDLPAAADVHLQIFSILGEEIASPVRDFQPAGVHRISWNAGQIPSGIYYYRLTAGSYQESRKLVLIR